MVCEGSTWSLLTDSFRKGFLILKHRFSKRVSVFQRQLGNVGTATSRFLVGTLPPSIPVADSPRGDECWFRATSLGLLRFFQGVSRKVCFLQPRRTFIIPKGGCLSSQDGCGGLPHQLLCITCRNSSYGNHGEVPEVRCGLPMRGLRWPEWALACTASPPGDTDSFVPFLDWWWWWWWWWGNEENACLLLGLLGCPSS